jgi:hypothetical protein
MKTAGAFKTSIRSRVSVFFSCCFLMAFLPVFAHCATWQNYGGGWYFLKSGYYTTYRYKTLERFRYYSATKQWQDKSLLGGAIWRNIGARGVSSAFIGDNKPHVIGSGWTFRYYAASAVSWWLRGTAYKFQYQYSTGQWWDYWTKGWSRLGSTKLSSVFLGDGATRSLGNGWDYRYFVTTATGWYLKGTAPRFQYQYARGQWWDYGYTRAWSAMGKTGLSSSFMGDGYSHTLGNGWYYQYSVSSNYSYWILSGKSRFLYSYALGQWADKGYNNAWFAVGSRGLSSAFIGDGAYHNVSSVWAYLFSSNKAYWKLRSQSSEAFRYDYALGQWWDKASGALAKLGAAGVSVGFAGDGYSHDLKKGYTYRFESASDRGYFTWDDTHNYYQKAGQWYWLAGSNWIEWSNPGGRSALGSLTYDMKPVSLNGKMYYLVDDGEGTFDIWKYDPKTHSSAMVFDGSGEVYELTAFRGNLYFRMYNDGDGVYRVWRYDISTNSASEITGPASERTLYKLTPGTGDDGKLFFVGHKKGLERIIYSYDPSTGSVNTVLNGFDGNISELTVIGSNIYFDNYTSEQHGELWRYDMTANELTRLLDSSSYILRGFTAIDGKLYFVSNQYENTQYRIYSYQPGDAGPTQLVTSNEYIDHITGMNGSLYFSSRSNSTGITDVWRHDLSSSTSSKVYDSNTAGSLDGLTALNGDLYFSLDSGILKYSVASNSTGTFCQTDTSPGVPMFMNADMYFMLDQDLMRYDFRLANR